MIVIATTMPAIEMMTEVEPLGKHCLLLLLLLCLLRLLAPVLGLNYFVCNWDRDPVAKWRDTPLVQQKKKAGAKSTNNKHCNVKIKTTLRHTDQITRRHKDMNARISTQHNAYMLTGERERETRTHTHTHTHGTALGEMGLARIDKTGARPLYHRPRPLLLSFFSRSFPHASDSIIRLTCAARSSKQTQLPHRSGRYG